ncbi:MAG: TolC family protein [Hymenobacteraceae bacterium]|nr:TolC family protein [Hymenobacteraceae bacterium]
MRFTSFLLSLAVLLAAASGATAQPSDAPISLTDSLALDGTLRAVFDANPSLTQLQELVRQSEARVAQNRTGLLPQVTGTATYTRLDPVAKVNFPTGPGRSEELQFVPNNNYDVHVTAQYTLYDFGANKARIAVAESQRTTAQTTMAVARRDLAYGAVQSYYAILALRESLRVADRQIADLSAHQREVETRVQGGVATRFDVSQTRVRVAQAESQRLDLQNQLRQQEIQLARLLHRPESTAPVRGRLTYAPQTGDEATLVARAFEQRPELQLARDNQRLSDAQAALTSVANKPLLGVGAQVGGKNGYQPDIYQFRPNFTGVVQLTVPIFDGNKNRNQRVEAAAGQRAAAARLLDVQEQVRADVRSALAQLQSQAARYDNAQLQITLTQDALTRAQTRQRAQVGTNIDVLDAETALAQARLAQLQATYGYLLGQYQLKRATGESFE